MVTVYRRVNIDICYIYYIISVRRTVLHLVGMQVSDVLVGPTFGRKLPMHTMTLFDRPKGCKNKHRNAVVDELGKLMSQKLRLFRTFASTTQGDVEWHFVFATTHKDTDLMFGTFSKEMLGHLGHLLMEEFVGSHEPHILVYKGGASEDGWFVTRTDNPQKNEYTFTFSPAQGRIS